MLKCCFASGTLALFMTAAAGATSAPVCTLVPGWTQSGPARAYVGENLYEYMDGNSEGYLIYGFQKMEGVTCKQGEVTLVIDISEMGDSDSAYGMFTATRDLRQPGKQIGMGGQIVPRRAMFAKGSSFVEIAANPEGDHSAALQQWVAAIEPLVSGSSTTPAALAWFPPDGQQSLRLVPESVLGLRILKRGYLAQYDYGKGFAVLETSPQSAGAVMEKLRARFTGVKPAQLGEESFTATDPYLGSLCVFRKGRYIAGYAIKGEGHDATALSAALAEKVR